MSVFDEILCKLNEISSRYVSCLNDDIKVAYESLDKFAEEYQNGRGKRETIQKSKIPVNTLQSIDEDEDENPPRDVRKSKEGAGEKKRLSNKRNKQEVDGMSSPEQEKRQKRNASVRAQNNITKQNLEALRNLNQNIVLLIDDEEEEVNVSLTQKLRREEPAERPPRARRDKENMAPVPLLPIKQEKISLPPEPMDLEVVPDIEVKQETIKVDSAMPPPSAPIPKPRNALPKDKSTDSEEEQSGKRRARTRKQTDNMPPPPAPAERPARASRRATRPADDPPEPRPKRTRGKKKASESSTTENESSVQENCVGSPAEKPRPKRTRRGQKAAEKEAAQKPPEPAPEPIVPKEERISQDTASPAIPQKTVKKNKNTETSDLSDTEPNNKSKAKSKQEAISLEETRIIIEPKNDLKSKKGKTKVQEAISLEETQVICPLNATVTIMDKTVVLPNGLMDHTDGKNAKIMDETVIIDKNSRETMVIEKPQAVAMDATVVIEKESAPKDGTADITDDLSLLTDDGAAPGLASPPAHNPPEPTSAVKAKVQQFEEMAARTTRTKTRAMAKKNAETENCTPPDKTSNPILSADTLTKMNNMIFNGKTTQISASATKPTSKIPPAKTMPASASKLTALSKATEEHDAHSKDDARKKKEAMLEAKKEQQRRKREEKMAAAAAARELAEKERRAAMEAAAKERMEKQAHADQEKLVRLKEVEKRRAELARKAAETEERRRGDEAARAARLAEDQRRAAAARRRQLRDDEATKKEAAMMAKEIEKRHKEYLEKQKLKQRMEADKMHTPLKAAGTPCGKAAAPMEPVYMSDGFQYLNSDSEDDETRPKPKVPAPAWGTSKARYRKLALQHLLATAVVDRLFSVRVHSPDLRAIFPALERRELKRTSSAVWRTPPALRLSRVHESPI